MGTIADILTCAYVISVFLRGIRCDLLNEVQNVLEKSNENLYYQIDESLRQSSIQYINYPVSYWNEFSPKLEKSEICVKFPPPYSVKFENLYWQIYKTSNGTLRLYNSYLDTRKLAGKPTVRILAMVNRQKPRVNLYCLLWFNNSTVPLVSEVSEFTMIWQNYWLDKRNPMAYLPYLMSCRVPNARQDEIPSAVMLTEQPCQQTWNVLKVIHEKPATKQMFAVCVKGLDFPFWDISYQLIEWIEINRLVGVDKIVFYKFQVHPNVEKVLRYYIQTGYIEVVPLTYSQGYPDALRVANNFRKLAIQYEQVIPYNDCWNKNIYKYDYISLLDTDELIIPIKANTWKELIDDIEIENQKNGSQKYSSYVSREARFAPKMLVVSNIPFYMTMSRRILRHTHSAVGIQSKSIHDTERVLTVHNHYYVHTFQGYNRRYEMDISIAQLNHYRYCEPASQQCSTNGNYTIDVSQWKYFHALKSRMIDVMKEMGIDSE